ncbi:MAG: LacI family DNA-binding transcriptional regulator [Caldilineales bacterium]|nr:LacI family DNA-binding transcriptional regulator [Caldilineales bacterium]
MSATMKDVAAKAGVSETTVARVMHNRKYVSQQTRSRVLAAMQSLGYQVPHATLNRHDKTHRVIGLAFSLAADSVFADPHLMAFMRGVGLIAAERNCHILMAPTGTPEDVAASLRRLFRTPGVDGAIVIGMRAAVESGLDLNKSPFPLVVRGYHMPGRRNTVHADNRRGALQATRHLIGLGHTRIGVISASIVLTDLDERLEGYKTALAEAHIPFRQELVVFGDLTTPGGAGATPQLMAQNPPPTAIFAFNDRMAIGAIQRLKSEGLRVPEDISVIGFDDIPMAELYEPALTTVRQPALEMGKTAARMLLGLVEGKIDSFPEATLPALLVVRDSCGGKTMR